MKVKGKYIIIPFLILSSCKQKSNPDYYFPVEKFISEKTYTFVNQSDNQEKSYWHMKTSFQDQDTLFQTSIFDGENRINEVIEEKISKGNASLIGYTIYNYDQEGKQIVMKCKILDDQVYQANQSENESIQWKVSFSDVNSQTCEISKKRSFVRYEKNRKTFKDEFELNIVEKSFTNKYSMISTYAKDTGIVAFILTLPSGQIKNFKLVSQSESR